MSRYIINLFNFFYDTTKSEIKKEEYKKEYKTYIKDKNFVYPELLYIGEKENIGIALPGGGLRACVYSYGVLRALHHLGILQKCFYMSSVSGSSWLTSVYAYQKKCDNLTFLGKYIPPEELTLEKLKHIENPDEFTNVLHDFKGFNYLIKYFIRNKLYELIIKNNENINDVWSKCLGEFIYKKYNLNDFTTMPSLSLLNKECPFLIIMGCVYCADINIVEPIEFTPLYYGIPNNNPGIKASGIYIEPKGYIDDKNNILSIMKTASISSNAIPSAYKLNNTLYNMLEFSYMKYYDQELQLLDGGTSCSNNIFCGEQTGLLSLIKRNISTIILVCPIPSTDNTNITIEKLVEDNTFLSSYFGYPDNSNDIQVFETKYWNVLVTEFKELILNNKPLVVKLNLDIVPNKKYEISGGHLVSVIFIHPSQNEWLSKLPTETQDFIHNDTNIWESKLSFTNINNANFLNYPYTSYIHENYSIELVNAMSQNAAYDVISSKFIFNIE
jgi:hypothetical protein